jgi:hypothetical protein
MRSPRFRLPNTIADARIAAQQQKRAARDFWRAHLAHFAVLAGDSGANKPAADRLFLLLIVSQRAVPRLTRATDCSLASPVPSLQGNTLIGGMILPSRRSGTRRVETGGLGEEV